MLEQMEWLKMKEPKDTLGAWRSLLSTEFWYSSREIASALLQPVFTQVVTNQLSVCAYSVASYCEDYGL